jgi:hypothetical protein
MCQKWKGDCGLWVLNDIILKILTHNGSAVGGVKYVESIETEIVVF